MAISKDYRNAIARLNRANNKKPGSKGYITPKQALSYKRKYKDVAAVEKAVEKIRTDKELKATAKEYNRYMGYKKGDSGYITSAKARAIGIEDLKEYAADAEANYGEAVRNAEADRKAEANRKRIHTRRVKQSIKDEEKLKPYAEELRKSIEKQKDLLQKQAKRSTKSEYDEIQKELNGIESEINKKFEELMKKRRDMTNKYRKMAKLPELTSDLHLERYSIKDKIDVINDIMKDRKGKDEYGLPTTLYTQLRNRVNATTSVIFDAMMSTQVGIDGEIYMLDDIIATTHIDNKLFWNAYHAWAKDTGGLLLQQNGRRHSDEVTASAFFSTPEGDKLLQTMLKQEFKNRYIVWDVDEEVYAHGRNKK